MKWLVIILALLSVSAFGLGAWAQHTGKSADEKVISGVYYIIGIILGSVDIVIFIIWKLVT